MDRMIVMTYKYKQLFYLTNLFTIQTCASATMRSQYIPNLSRLKIGKSVKLKKTLILSAHDQFPLKSISYGKQTPIQPQIPVQQRCFWATQKPYLQVDQSKKEKQGSTLAINQKKQLYFCKFIKQLQPIKTPMYFYHQTSFKSRAKSSRTLVLRCMMSRTGLAAWLLNEGVFKQQYFETLMYEMKKKQTSLDSIRRKYLILDKQVLTNKKQFCEVIQYHSFDILCLPAGSLQLNPIQKWFISLHNELQSTNNYSYQTFESKLQEILYKYESHSLFYYVAQFPKEVDSILNKNQ